MFDGRSLPRMGPVSVQSKYRTAKVMVQGFVG